MLYGKWFSVLSLFVIAALLLSACQPIVAPSAATEPPPPHGLRFDAPPYAVDGPYAVGIRYYTIPAAGENDRELTATVWYPAQQPDGATPQMVYEQQFAPGQFPPFSVFGHAALDAPLDASGAPYPLVVYSHAHWSMGQEVPYFTEHLASRGFVVISVDHEDNWSTDMGPMAYETMIRRPQEVTRQIDFAETLAVPDGDLAGMTNTSNVGVAGWSMGGITSMAVAGARMDLAGLRAWCEANPTRVEENSFACIDILDHEAEMAEFAGLDSVPAELWPPMQDERIAAAVRLSGSLFMYGSEGMGSVNVPVMLMHGGGEEAADPSLEVGDPYASVGSQHKAEVIFESGGHLMFFSSCADSPRIAEIGFPMFCTDPVWDMDRAHDLINHFATAFLLAELKGDADAAAALAPENVAFPGIEYESTGYGAEQATDGEIPMDASGYVDNNGVKIYYEVEGQGPPLVLVHWASGSTQDWRLFGYVDALKDDYRLILVDMRGHGKSDKPDDPAAYAAATQASDIAAVLDELDIDKANYFGYSLGGRLGWALAKYAPERFQSLIIGGHIPVVWDDSGWTAWMFSQGAEGWARGLEDFARSLDRWSPDIYPAYVADDFGAIAMASYGLNSEDLSSNLPGTTLPILLLVGTNDDMYAEMEAAAQRLPNATMATMPGLDHGQGLLQIDQAVPHITEFLSEVNAEAETPLVALDDAAVAKIESIVQKTMTDYPAPGFELCIVKDGQVAYSKGFGLADVADNRAVTPQSLQIQASVSKPFVAMAVMQLAEQGMIDLDAPITTYLPYFTMADERYKEITVRMLLGHRSGMADTPASWTEPLDPAVNPLEQAVRGLSKAELLFAPDEASSYSGYGYITLGAINAAVTGQPFESYMAEQWLAPLGMTNSTFIAEDVDPALRMTAHKSDVDGKATPTEIACDGRNGSACNLWSNCEDMAKWAQLLLNKGEIDGARVLQPESIDAMWTPVSETGWLEMMGPWYGSPIANYGLGWMLGETEGYRLAGHAGGVEGANSQILLAPDDGLAVITMDNWLDLAAIPAYPASNAATDVMYTLLGIEPQ
jgi:CubicO group peptidase (beta-lactamase class C family)/predicted dienelactone hydrolase